MPSWRLHNAIAREIGIPETVANDVNRIIDIYGIHDGREIPEVFLEDARKSYEVGGYAGLKAFFLHHVLDRLAQKLRGEAYRQVWDKPARGDEYVLKTTIIDAEDWLRYNLREFEYKSVAEKALSEVLGFVEKNYKRIQTLITNELEK